MNELMSALAGSSLISRVETLKELAYSTKRIQPFRFRGSSVNMPVVSVKITLPVYRIENRRTKTLQEEYLVKHPEISSDFFENDKDSIAVQKVQDEILRGLIEEKDLYDVFSNPKVQQDEPIICTRQGVVVNGNRRLCAWRKLFEEDCTKFSHFESVDVMLLPEDTDENDLNNIERELQIKRAIKSEYSWHARANMIRMDYERVHSYDELKQMYDMQKSELDLAMDCFSYAKAYLASIGKPGQWSLVDKQEFAFQKIVKEKNKIADMPKRKLFEACASAILQANKSSINNRRYDLIPQIAKNLEPIIEVLQRDILQSSDISPVVFEPLGIAIGNQEETKLFAIEKECRKPENLTKVVDIVDTVIESINIKNRDSKACRLLIDDITKVSTDLISIKTRDLDDKQEELPAVLNQLKSIEDTCSFIKEWVNKHANLS